MMTDTAHDHAGDAAMMAEHAAALGLVRRDAATHVAIRSGDWNDPTIWRDGAVPGDGARVVIGAGVTVDYATVSDARLLTVRVDGHLRFATDTDSRLVLDTMVVDATGRLTVGTVDNPVKPDTSVEIVIADNGPIDTVWDPMLLSRGVVSLGAVEIAGAEKDSHLKVAVDPMAGDTALLLSEPPDGWRPGDTIVVAGTHYEGYKWDNDIRAVRYYEPEDEVRTIIAVDGNRVVLDRPLVFDHDAPRDDLKTSVANYSRSVTVATENADRVDVSERGHVMFMHSDDVDVRHAAFYELGRTDKSASSFNVGDLEAVASDSNVQGRYAFHLHRTGMDDPDDPAMVVGNAVFGSPGWGFVHHDSNAVLHENATFNTFGAGFVAETGNEIGRWSDNIAIQAQGLNRLVKDAADVAAFDLARTGDGFWFQGRMVESAGNIAASVNNGFVYMHRGNGMLSFDAGLFDYPEALGEGRAAWPDDAPILHFRDNEVFAASEGLQVVKANPDQGHDVHSVLQDFTAWNVRSGAHLEYTSHYSLLNFDLVGKDPTPFNRSSTGIDFGNNVTDMTIVGARIDGFDTAGIDLNKTLVGDALIAAGGSQVPALHDYKVVDAQITNSAVAFANLDPAHDVITGAAALPSATFAVVLDKPLTYREGWPDPDARKVAISGVKIDSLGSAPLPSGTDDYSVGIQDVIRILETDGYYVAEDGGRYFILEAYYSDRLTGEVHKFGHLVEIDANVPLGNPHFGYRNARYAGPLPDPAPAPVTAPDTASTTPEAAVIIDVLSNDASPAGRSLRVDGLVQPVHGRVVDNGDGTVTYTPDIGFTGDDAFWYWVTDGSGAFIPGAATVSVLPASPPEPVVPEAPSIGSSGDDLFAFRPGALTARGGAGADVFRLDARSFSGDASLAVLDFNPAEGDSIALRHFREGAFSDAADPGNALSVGYGGRHADIDTLADLRELAAGGVAIDSTADGDAVLVLPTGDGGAHRLALVGVAAADLSGTPPPPVPGASPIPDAPPPGAALVGTEDSDRLVFRDGFTSGWAGGGADVFRIDARAVAAGATLTIHDFRIGQGDRIDLRHFREGAFDDALDPTNPLDVAYGGRHATIGDAADLRELIGGETGLGQTAAGDAILQLPASQGMLSLVLIGTAYESLL